MSFDALAPHYRWLEWVLAGEKLQCCRTAFLGTARPPKRVLLAGEGHGRFLSECRRQWPHARITCVDASARMLHQARRRLMEHRLSCEALDFIHADVLDWTPAETQFDLLVTHFFLDCFPPSQLERVVRRLAGAAAPEARWWVADFQVPAAGLARWRALLIHKGMYSFFRLATRLPARQLTAPDQFLQREGFALRQRAFSEWGLLHADEWERTGGFSG
jgi:ubiquinone/menaquinone biosynthesis C-methylase UbiE